MSGDLKDRIADVSKDLPRGWQARLAEHCGVSQPSVADWVSGKTKTLDGLNLTRAAQFFGVNPLWLGAGKGPKFPGAGDTIATEPPAAYAVRRPVKAGAAQTDYRTIVHTLADALEQSGRVVTVRQFIEMADATYRKLSR
jgi:transcriptional regulator with XRE-family HTH domain